MPNGDSNYLCVFLDRDALLFIIDFYQ